MGSTPLGGSTGFFLKKMFSNFSSHIKDSKWGRKYIFMNYTCFNGSPQKSHFSLPMGNCPIPVAEDSGLSNSKGHSGMSYFALITFAEVSKIQIHFLQDTSKVDTT